MRTRTYDGRDSVAVKTFMASLGRKQDRKKSRVSCRQKKKMTVTVDVPSDVIIIVAVLIASEPAARWLSSLFLVAGPSLTTPAHKVPIP